MLRLQKQLNYESDHRLHSVCYKLFDALLKYLEVALVFPLGCGLKMCYFTSVFNLLNS
jgi:hypothetical protein